ncbi:hypothetical protein CYMTET_26955, partial [Cymbomonas tetramitiformis]
KGAPNDPTGRLTEEEFNRRQHSAEAPKPSREREEHKLMVDSDVEEEEEEEEDDLDGFIVREPKRKRKPSSSSSSRRSKPMHMNPYWDPDEDLEEGDDYQSYIRSMFRCTPQSPALLCGHHRLVAAGFGITRPSTRTRTDTSNMVASCAEIEQEEKASRIAGAKFDREEEERERLRVEDKKARKRSRH